jgi:hypothetical protein
VWAREPYVDATKVAANADVDSLIPRFNHEATAHMTELFANDSPEVVTESESESLAENFPEGVVRLPCREIPEESSAVDPPWRLLEERRLEPLDAAAWDYKRASVWSVSTTDPDVTPLRTGARGQGGIPGTVLLLVRASS